MYEDKKLVCKECGQEFIFTAGEQEFYAEHGFASAARPAVTPARPASVPTARCSPPSAPAAAKRPRFPSVPARTALFIAASASPA